jgi:hypothetical protein
VGVLAEEVQRVVPETVVRGRDGDPRVYYNWVGVRFEPYDRWIPFGARIETAQIEPLTARMSRPTMAAGH